MRKTQGFTIVELLVVIAIIGTLVAILLPAVNTAREASRRTSCVNNTRSVAQAMMQHATAKQNFPGRVSQVKTTEGWKLISWAGRLLPYLEQNPLYDSMLTPITTTAEINPDIIIPGEPTSLDVMGCASASSLGTGQSNLVANTGMWDEKIAGNLDDKTANGICHALVGTNRIGGKGTKFVELDRKVSVGYLSQNDGVSSTMLLSENLQGGPWWSLDEGHHGMTWYYNADTNRGIVNIDKKSTLPYMNGNLEEGQRQMTRPSSNHPGGANIAFADGRTQFLSEEVNQQVYGLMLSSNAKRANLPEKNNIDPNHFQRMVLLKESDYAN